MKRKEEEEEAKGIREALKRMVAEGEIEELSERRVGKRSGGSKEGDVDVDEMEVDGWKGSGKEGMSPMEIAERRVDDVIDGVRRIGRYEEGEVIEVGCQVNALIRELVVRSSRKEWQAR